jgi:hypothetical protein
MKQSIAVVVMVTMLSVQAIAQSYTSTGNGNWTAPGKWNNTDGWGTSTPPVNGGHGSGTVTMNHNLQINTSYTIGSASLNINAGKTLTVDGNMTLGGGSAVNVSGNLTIIGDLTLNSRLNILPGGVVIVYGSATVNSDLYLVIGTSAGGPPYADLVVKNDIKQQGSGDITVSKNGRVAVFGKVSDNGGGGTFLTLNQGAQMYVDVKVEYTGGGNSINNNNAVNPFGLYVNGTTTNTGGGSSTTSNKANKATMQTTNAPFAAWIASQESTLMPVTLMFFKIAGINEHSISLEWATASEHNFDYFVVESSTDGVVFTETGRVQGNGTTGVRHDYTYDVINPVVGRSYFRLKSVDFDGYTEMFSVVSVVYESSKSVRLYPNPVVDSSLNVEFNFDPSEDVVVTITSLTGMEVAHHSLNGMENLLRLSLDPGTYLVKIASHEINTVTRIVVR